MSALSKVGKLRASLARLRLDAFIVGSADAHQSEYVCDRDTRRAYLSDFTGSAGTALVLADKALLWTDGRYFLQASQELSDDWTLMRQGDTGVLELQPWLCKHLASGSRVGVDPYLMSTNQALALQTALNDKGMTLVPVEANPVDAQWADQPGFPCTAAIAMPLERHGKPHGEKISEVQNFLQENNADALCLSLLDEIAWLFNIRGSDVVCNPVLMAYAVVTSDAAHLFCDERKITEEVRQHLLSSTTEPTAAVVHVHAYESAAAFITDLKAQGKRVGVDPAQLNWSIYRAAGGKEAPQLLCPVTMAKALKNDVELDGVRQAHVRDGVALTAFLHWLETAVQAAPDSLSEYDVAVKLEEFRHAMPGHQYPSFDTIAGYGSNGAVIHYKPAQETALKLGTDSLFLLDSGGQYLDGTTDVTRTMHFGPEPTTRMIDCYTMVLKGHIALATVVFPEGTVGSRIDAVARMSLWQAGLDYNHGTGHGVGTFLNVHEGPQGIGFRKRENEAGFRIGMTTSNEPGYYEAGAFGIRIENVCITVDANTPNNFGDKRYCTFETVTMTPISAKLINRSMLTPTEIQWLNEYHANVRQKLLPGIRQYYPETEAWLIAETEAI